MKTREKIRLFHWMKVTRTRSRDSGSTLSCVVAKMEEDEEVELLLSPLSKDRLAAFTTKELSNFLVKKGFLMDHCRILEGMFLSCSVLAVNSVF